MRTSFKQLLSILLVTMVIVCFITPSVAQNSDESEEVVSLEDNLFKANIMSPGFAYERKVFGPTSVNLNAGMRSDLLSFGGIIIGGGGFGGSLSLQPYAELQYRLYLNLKSREEAGKSTFGNSANYIAPTLTQRGDIYDAFAGRVSNSGFLYGIRVGMQRTQRSGFFYRVDLGLAFQKVGDLTYMEPATTYNLGYVLGMRKKLNNK